MTDTEDDSGLLFSVHVACVAPSEFVPGTWVARAFWPEMRCIGDYGTEEDARAMAQAYTDRVLAHLKRARSLAGIG